MSDWDLLLSYSDDKDSFNPGMKLWAKNCERLQRENPLW